MVNGSHAEDFACYRACDCAVVRRAGCVAVASAVQRVIQHCLLSLQDTHYSITAAIQKPVYTIRFDADFDQLLIIHNDHQ